jgi:hypothetical protein
MTTIEAVFEKDGKIRLLSKVRFPESRRALITIFDAAPDDSMDPSVREPIKGPVDDSEVLGLWADRDDSAQEIARKIREANRRTT